MSNLFIKYKEMDCYNKVKYIKVDNIIYHIDSLSSEAQDVILALSYIDYYDPESVNNISQMLGQETLLQGMKELENINVKLI